MKNKVVKIFSIVLLILFVSSISLAATQTVKILPMTYKILATNITVGDSATALPATAMIGRNTIEIYNNSSSTIYIGSSAVADSNGRPLLPQSAVTIDADDTVVIYGITSTGTADIRTLECK